MSKPLRVGMIAGEMSGDLLGAQLMIALRENYSGSVQFEGIGGPKMIAEGFDSHIDQDRLSVMGIVEVLKRLPELLRIRKSIRQYFLKNPPDVFIGIDSPDFNLPVEQTLKQAGITTVHYVSPSVWAWRQKRVIKIAQSVDLMLALLPFEVDFYKEHNVPVKFVGHPLADRLPLEPDQATARLKLGFSDEDEVVAVLPGSRGSEIEMLADVFLQAAERCRDKRPGLKFIVPAANEKRKQQLEEILTKYTNLNIKLVLGQSVDVMAASDVVLMASGTTTLEAMLLKRPMVISYRFSAISSFILTRMVKTPFVGLPNIIAGKQVVPEILHEKVNPKALAEALLRYFDEPELVLDIKRQFTEAHSQMRLNADQKAAEAVLTLVGHKIS